MLIYVVGEVCACSGQKRNLSLMMIRWPALQTREGQNAVRRLQSHIDEDARRWERRTRRLWLDWKELRIIVTKNWTNEIDMEEEEDEKEQEEEEEKKD